MSEVAGVRGGGGEGDGRGDVDAGVCLPVGGGDVL